MATDRLGVVAICKAKTGQEDALRELLLPTVPWGLEKAGCLEYTIHVDRDDPATFVFYETWESRTALDDHRSHPEFHDLIDKVLPLVSGPFQVILLKRIG